MNLNSKHATQALLSGLLLAILVATTAAYSPALPGPFLLDDFHNIGTMQGGIETAEDLREHLFVPVAGATNRPIARASLLVDDNAWPSTATQFKWTNLMLHLLCGVLVFAVFRRIFEHFGRSESRAAWLALSLASIWLLHPFNLSTTMYVIQRMTQLSALFTLCGLLAYLYLRPASAHSSWKRTALLAFSTGAFVLLATFSKENGILLVVLLAVLELTLFSGAKRGSTSFSAWRWLFIFLPAALLVLYVAYLPNWVDGYKHRAFSLQERLLTQPVILLEYLYRILSFRTFGIGVFQDDQVIRTSLLDPAVTFSLITWTLLIGVAWRIRAQQPVILFAALWFFGGHLLESTTIPLELYFDHRNYLPMLGPLAAAVFGIDALITKGTNHPRALSAAALSGLSLFAGAQLYLLAKPWGKADELVLLMATEHPDSPRATRSLVRWMEHFFQREQALDILDSEFATPPPRDVSLAMMSVDITCKAGLPHRYDLGTLALSPENLALTDGVGPTATQLIASIRSIPCPELLPGLYDLLEASPSMTPRLSSPGKRNAKLLRLNARELLRSGELERARDNLHRAYELHPSAGTAFALTEFWLTVGHIPSALAWLERTEELELKHRNPLRPNLSRTFAEKRALLENVNAQFKTADPDAVAPESRPSE